MPFAPPHPCNHAGCHALVRDASKCDRHRTDDRREVDAMRGTAVHRGYGSRWRKERQAYLGEHPWCTACEAQGRIVKAEVVDHKVPHKGDPEIFWDRSNWQSLCKRHHDIKTATESGFGRRRKGAGGF
jgi:5-methylcytosine-specific restriction enzyme A